MTEAPTAAAQLAVKLHDALQAVRNLEQYIETTNHVDVSVHFGDGKAEVSIHQCKPAQMNRAALMSVDAELHRDADGILRWVEVELDAVTLTFFRR